MCSSEDSVSHVAVTLRALVISFVPFSPSHYGHVHSVSMSHVPSCSVCQKTTRHRSQLTAPAPTASAWQQLQCQQWRCQQRHRSASGSPELASGCEAKPMRALVHEARYGTEPSGSSQVCHGCGIREGAFEIFIKWQGIFLLRWPNKAAPLGVLSLRVGAFTSVQFFGGKSSGLSIPSPGLGTES